MGHEALCAAAGLQAAGEGAPPTGDPGAEEPSAPIAALGAAAPPSGNLHMGTASEKWEVGATQAAWPLGGPTGTWEPSPGQSRPTRRHHLLGASGPGGACTCGGGAGGEQRGRPRRGWRLAPLQTRTPRPAPLPPPVKCHYLGRRPTQEAHLPSTLKPASRHRTRRQRPPRQAAAASGVREQRLELSALCRRRQASLARPEAGRGSWPQQPGRQWPRKGPL